MSEDPPWSPHVAAYAAAHALAADGETRAAKALREHVDGCTNGCRTTLEAHELMEYAQLCDVGAEYARAWLGAACCDSARAMAAKALFRLNL